MNKIKNYYSIINSIKLKPQSARELNRDMDISPQVLNKHLKRGLRLKEIAYFGNHPKKFVKEFLFHSYERKKGLGKTHHLFFGTLESGKLYKKMIKKYKKRNKDIIGEIVDFHRIIETFSKFQDIYAPDGTKMKADINRFYKERYKRINFNSTEEFNKFVKIIKMNPLMHWLAYREEKIRDELTIPMFKKMEELFVRINKN